MSKSKESQYGEVSKEVMDGHREENKKWHQRNDVAQQRQEQIKQNCTKRLVAVPIALVDVINGLVHGVREGVCIILFQEAINEIVIKHQNGNGGGN